MAVPVTGERIVVAHAVPDLLYGGLQRLTVQLAQLADPSRFASHILVFGAIGPLAATVGDAATVHEVGAQSKASMLWPRRVASLLSAIRPDVVHSHSGVWYKASLAARIARVPRVIHTDHGRMVPDPLSSRLVDGLASRWTDVVVAVSEPLAARLREHVVAHPDRVQLIRNGVDTDDLRPGMPGVRESLGVGPDTRVIGSVGRIERIKGYDVMIDAFARYRALPRAPKAVLVIAGDGDDRPLVESRARSHGVEGHVRFLGWRDDLSQLLASFDIFALTSRSEGTSVSLLEAMSAGVCPVVTSVGGNPAVLGPELAHRLVPSESPDGIAAGWADALESESARGRDATIARRLAQDRFSLHAMVSAYESIYADVRAPGPGDRSTGVTSVG